MLLLAIESIDDARITVTKRGDMSGNPTQVLLAIKDIGGEWHIKDHYVAETPDKHTIDTIITHLKQVLAMQSIVVPNPTDQQRAAYAIQKVMGAWGR